MERPWSQRVNRRGSEYTRGPPTILRAASDGLASESIGRGHTAPRVSKTGDTVQNRSSITKNYFCIFGFRSIKYKKPDLVYHPRPDRERKKNPKTGGSRPRFETLPPHRSRSQATPPPKLLYAPGSQPLMVRSSILFAAQMTYLVCLLPD